MQHRRLGHGPLEVSELSFGTWLTVAGGIGREQAIRCIHAALDHGITLFDTANQYGAGEAERVLGEALRSLRGFYISDNRQYTYLGVRGFMRPGDDNPRILLLVNGHRLNDKIYDTAAIGTEFPLDLELVDHIEVVRGPGSSLYGTNAIFGVIDIITREPGQKAAVEVSGDAGSLWSRRGRATLMGSLSAARGFRARGMCWIRLPVRGGGRER